MYVRKYLRTVSALGPPVGTIMGSRSRGHAPASFLSVRNNVMFQSHAAPLPTRATGTSAGTPLALSATGTFDVHRFSCDRRSRSPCRCRDRDLSSETEKREKNRGAETPFHHPSTPSRRKKKTHVAPPPVRTLRTLRTPVEFRVAAVVSVGDEAERQRARNGKNGLDLSRNQFTTLVVSITSTLRTVLGLARSRSSDSSRSGVVALDAGPVAPYKKVLVRLHRTASCWSRARRLPSAPLAPRLFPRLDPALLLWPFRLLPLLLPFLPQLFSRPLELLSTHLQLIPLTLLLLRSLRSRVFLSIFSTASFVWVSASGWWPLVVSPPVVGRCPLVVRIDRVTASTRPALLRSSSASPPIVFDAGL